MTEDVITGYTMARVALDEDRSGIGRATDAQLAAINQRFALRELRADDLFVVPVVMSVTDVDSYGTHQMLSSLRNYRADVRGQGAPMMMHHRTPNIDMLGGRQSGESPVGNWFDAVIRKNTASDDSRTLQYQQDPKTERWYYAPDEGKRVALGSHYKNPNAQLIETGYILRRVHPNGASSDDLISRIEGGVERSVSIQFTLNPVVAPGSQVRCDVCGGDLWDLEACQHIPLLEYEDEDADGGRVLATAGIDGGHQVEGSWVFKGAAPGSFVERTARLFQAGHVSRRDVAFLEEQYGARIFGSRTTFDLGRDDMPETPEGAAPPEPEGEAPEVTEEDETDEESPSAPEPTEEEAVGGEDPEGSDADEEDSPEEDLRAEVAALRAQLEEAEAALQEEPDDETRQFAEFGKRAHSLLVERVVKAKVRVSHQGYNRDAYEARIAKWDPAELEQELQELQAQARSTYSPGLRTPVEVMPRMQNLADDEEDREPNDPRRAVAYAG